MSLALARTVADAVLYEGYLLYPYRATSRKNQVRWQFGVLGPPGAVEDGLGEEASMTAQCLLAMPGLAADAIDVPSVRLHLRFLQLQQRSVERADADDPSLFVAVDELRVGRRLLFSWDEAVEQEVTWPAFSMAELSDGISRPVRIEGGDETEPLTEADGTVAGRIVRRRWPLRAHLRLDVLEIDGYLRLSVHVRNSAADRAQNKDQAIRTSLIGAHLLIEAAGAQFVSLLEPPPDAANAAASCQQHRCWPVLAGPAGSTDVVLASPIILYDHPEVAAESTGALFDSTEIDEILTLRVMTLTDQEKAEARATDPRAREIIDRCERMSPQELQQLHGILRDPHAGAAALIGGVHPGPEEFADALDPLPREQEQPWFETGAVPWWDPAVDESVQPEVDAVLIDGVSVSKGSHVRVHPSRRADAQDLFFEDQVARVTAVLSDVDGGTHVAVVLLDDPASDLHDWYGRYLYFAPDELEPLTEEAAPDQRKESQS